MPMPDAPVTITIDLTTVEAGILASAAAKLGITPEEWAQRAVTSDLSMHDGTGMQQVTS